MVLPFVEYFWQKLVIREQAYCKVGKDDFLTLKLSKIKRTRQSDQKASD